MKIPVKLVNNVGNKTELLFELTKDNIEEFLDFVLNAEEKVFINEINKYNHSENYEVIHLMEYPLLLDKDYLTKMIEIVDNTNEVTEDMEELCIKNNLTKLIAIQQYLDIREVNNLIRKLKQEFNKLFHKYYFDREGTNYGLSFYEVEEAEQSFDIPENTEVNIEMIYQVLRNIEIVARTIYHFDDDDYYEDEE